MTSGFRGASGACPGGRPWTLSAIHKVTLTKHLTFHFAGMGAWGLPVGLSGWAELPQRVGNLPVRLPHDLIHLLMLL